MNGTKAWKSYLPCRNGNGCQDIQVEEIKEAKCLDPGTKPSYKSMCGLGFPDDCFPPQTGLLLAEFVATARGATLFFPIHTQSLKTLTHVRSTYKPNFKDELTSHFKEAYRAFSLLNQSRLKRREVQGRAQRWEESWLCRLRSWTINLASHRLPRKHLTLGQAIVSLVNHFLNKIKH